MNVKNYYQKVGWNQCLINNLAIYWPEKTKFTIYYLREMVQQTY